MTHFPDHVATSATPRRQRGEPCQSSGVLDSHGRHVIDLILLGLIQVIVVAVLVAMGDPAVEGSRSMNLATAIVWSVWLMYSSMEIFSGGTLGKKLFGLRIARQDGKADQWRLFLRWLTKQFPAIAMASSR